MPPYNRQSKESRTMSAMIAKFLPSYVGSKAMWVHKLDHLRGRHFTEYFCGSCAITAGLASGAVLNDVDYNLVRYLKDYVKQPIVGRFTSDDYFAKRRSPDWYRWLYYLQKMSFSGVYRWSKNGYNVPIRSKYRIGSSIDVSKDIATAIARHAEISPTVTCMEYYDLPMPSNPDVAVLDPPYEGSNAPYNTKEFDYARYWRHVHMCIESYKAVIIFDLEENIKEHLPGVRYETRMMRVVGHHPGRKEAMCIIGGT